MKSSGQTKLPPRRRNAPPRRKNLHVTVGNTTVRIYRGEYDAKGKTYEQFTLSYREGGKRLRKTFHTYDEAQREAEKIADRLEQGHRDTLKLTNADSELFTLAQREVKKSGVPLLEAIREFTGAVKLLPKGCSLLDAVKEYAQRHPENLPTKTVAEVVDAFLAAKSQDGASADYLRTLKYHLTPLKDRFRTAIGKVASSDLDTWLRSLGHTARTRRNILLSATTMFRFAQGLGYLPKNVPTEAEGVTKPKAKKGAIGLITPVELAALLHGAESDHQKIYFALGAFTGLRASELTRLEWHEINLPVRHVEVVAAKAKTAARRLVPICDALNEWLRPYAHHKGPVFTSQRQGGRMTEWARKLLGHWPQNALRHSYVSYRVAQTQNVAQTALAACRTFRATNFELAG